MHTFPSECIAWGLTAVRYIKTSISLYQKISKSTEG